MAIQMRRGEKKDFKPERLKIGEFAVPTDTGEVYIKTSDDTTKGLATLDTSGKLEQMPTYEDVGAAEKVHKHPASDITSGTLPIENGGTGATTITGAQKNLQWYTSWAQLGLTSPCSTPDIIAALPTSSIFSASINGTSQVSDVPTDWGQLTILKSRDRKIILFNQSLSGGGNGNNFYFGEHRGTYITWYKIFTANPNCIIPIENGGTGGADIYTAQSNLGLLKRYPDFSHLILPETLRDVRDIFRLMENNSYIETTVGSNVSPKIQAICPIASGCLKIVRFYNQYTGYAEFHSNPISENSKWVGSLHNDRGFVWNKVYTSNCIIPIENGGTGATTTDQALTNLGAAPSNHAHSASDITSGTLPIENGGTGASTAVQALENLGAVPQERTINLKPLSSDIELNCTDIGAAEENHVHDFSELINTPTTLAGYGITDVLSNEHTHDFNSITEKPTTLAGYGITDATPYEAKSGADFNEMKTPGLYTMRGSTANAPTSGSYHSLIVNKSDTGNYVQQIAIKESSYEVYMRYLNGSSWSTWKQISTADHVQSIDKGGTGATTASAAISNLHGVEATTSEITYYISPSGSNSNSGKSSSSPFKTLAYALSKLPKFLKHDVTINVAQGTYTESEVLITGFVGEGTLSIVGSSSANAVGAENYIFSNGIKINKNQGRIEFHGIGSSDGFRVFNSPDVVLYYCHAYSPSLVSGRAGFFSTHSKVFTVYCRATNFQNGFHSYQGGDLTAMCGVCTNCSYPWCSGEGAVLYVYGASSSGFISAHNYSSAGVLVGTYGGTLGI